MFNYVFHVLGTRGKKETPQKTLIMMRELVIEHVVKWRISKVVSFSAFIFSG